MPEGINEPNADQPVPENEVNGFDFRIYKLDTDILTVLLELGGRNVLAADIHKRFQGVKLGRITTRLSILAENGLVKGEFDGSYQENTTARYVWTIQHGGFLYVMVAQQRRMQNEIMRRRNEIVRQKKAERDAAREADANMSMAQRLGARLRNLMM